MISQQTIDAVLDRADIVTIVSEAVPDLKRKGSTYVCCCPFHQEKTPSFHVSPARQTWHCFGACQEGGNVIKFVMKHENYTFPQAVKSLAKRFGIDCFEEEESDAEREQRLHRESIWNLNERVANHFVQNLYDPANGNALQYAINRFGEQYVRESGMGYAAKENDLFSWAGEHGENFELLEEASLLGVNSEKNEYYDFFRDRIVFPIRDRSKHIVGFTARDLSGSSNSKYLNSKESTAYKKKYCVFGIDEAIREAVKKDQFFLVEGAPDVLKMHSVGIYNVVAPLGGAWTKEQFALLKKSCNSLCFINDADPPAEGEAFGAGLKYVIKNGKQAITMGFRVSVRELPLGEGNKKQDPGSFFTAASQLDLLPEEEFCGWYARKIWSEKDNVHQKTDKVKEIAEVASYIEDNTTIDILLDELNKIRKGKDTWRQRIMSAKWARQREESNRKQEVDLHQYGFYEVNNCYVGLSDKGEETWCNFTMKPLYHIMDNDKSRRTYEIKNFRGTTKTIELMPEDLVSLSRFRQRLESRGNFTWEVGEGELIKLKRYLYDNTETASLVKQMGWNPVGFYAFGNGIWKDGSFLKTNQYGIVSIAKDDEEKKGDQEHYNWYIPAAVVSNDEGDSSYERQRKFVHRTLQNIRFEDYMKQFIDVYGDNGKVGLCYWLASLFRDIVTSYTRSFPLLNLFGPKGSGKTELGAALMAFFVVDNKAPNLKNSTPIALNDDVAYVCDALVHFDEYKNDLHPRMIEFLKGLYDGVGRTKMGGSSFEDRKMTAVKTGVIFSGQEIPTADIALFHRCVFLSFQTSEFTKEQRQRFAKLRAIQEMGLTHLTLQVLELRKRVQGSFLAKYSEVAEEINKRTNGAPLETRIVENWSKLLAIFSCVEERLKFPFTYDEIFDISLKLMVKQNSMSGEGNELAHFWRMLMFLRDNGNLYEEGDYRIKNFVTFKSDIINNREFSSPRPILLLNVSRVFTLYKEAARRSGDKIIPDDALREYLKHTEYYYGYLNCVRFKSFANGYQEMKEDGIGGMKPVTRVLRAMAFDYTILKEKYNISLESSTSTLNKTDDELLEEEARRKKEERMKPKEFPFEENE